ncbi:MAG: dihydrofolate reductase [Crocinitomicaceae bacterium]|nr:dipeptidyl peptidase 3 [Flavobacteriales bacterium]NQZ34947.1 dihydrofolate reductase [Crocinitomicaceae bacterium]
MSFKYFIAPSLILATLLFSCGDSVEIEENSDAATNETEVGGQVDRFADVQVLRYDIVDFDKLTIDQKKLVYFMSQAGLAGRDIIYDQNNSFNLEIRNGLEHIIENYDGDKNTDDWKNLMVYTKQIWFANGIHHHYGMNKFTPKFSRGTLRDYIGKTGAKISNEAMTVIFDPNVATKRKDKGADKDMIVASSNGFYGPGVTQDMVDAYYKEKINTNTDRPIEYGLNSTMILKDGNLYEDVWKIDGKYGKAIEKIVFWLEKAVGVAENDQQEKALEKLIEYYKTGDLTIWDDYNVLWAKSTEGDIDWINGFIETYGDALGKRASFESIVQITDFEASKQMQVVAENAQWFEDNSPLIESHKKKEVKGVSYKVVQVASESGDASPSTPIGVNLPNNNWIRQEIGSKSVSLGNIISAYSKAGGSGMLNEFANDEDEIALSEEHSYLAGKLHTALHEVIGHASGQINKGVGQPAETMRNYASTLEEARADLVGLYYIMDQKMIDLGLVTTLDVGKAEYDGYIRNGMMTQLQRLELGDDVTEEHMQNRQLVASWAIERGADENVIERITRDGKTYFNINDYDKLRAIFGELLREIQRIKSEGDYEAGKALVENYGVKVDLALHKEVLERVKPLDLAPYRGFVNPVLVPVEDENGEIIDIKIENTQTFVEQMLYYRKMYGTLD